MSQSVDRQIGILPAIESEGYFLAVGLEMLRADFMPRVWTLECPTLFNVFPTNLSASSVGRLSAFAREDTRG